MTLLAALLLAACTKQTPAPPQAPEVLVSVVVPRDVPLYDEFVGTLDGSVNAAIQARVQGYLISQNYVEGGHVHKGDLLFQIDPRPFEALVAQAKAALAQAEATSIQQKSAAERSQRLREENAASQQDLENAIQQAAAAKANVEAQRAALQEAQLNLEYTAVRSPIDGIAGLVRAQIGDLVGPSSGILTTVSDVDPIRAFFTVSDQRYITYAQRWASRPEAKADYERQLEYELLLADGTVYPHKGHLFANDTGVDLKTGSQRIVANFPNPGDLLRPGQFVRVRMRSELRKQAILIPQRAVSELQGGWQVAVVGSDNRVELREVTAGRRIGGDWLIDAGLKPGETLVIEGLQKVRNGSLVTPTQWTRPVKATSSNP